MWLPAPTKWATYHLPNMGPPPHKLARGEPSLCLCLFSDRILLRDPTCLSTQGAKNFPNKVQQDGSVSNGNHQQGNLSSSPRPSWWKARTNPTSCPLTSTYTWHYQSTNSLSLNNLHHKFLTPKDKPFQCPSWTLSSKNSENGPETWASAPQKWIAQWRFPCLCYCFFTPTLASRAVGTSVVSGLS